MPDNKVKTVKDIARKTINDIIALEKPQHEMLDLMLDVAGALIVSASFTMHQMVNRDKNKVGQAALDKIVRDVTDVLSRATVEQAEYISKPNNRSN